VNRTHVDFRVTMNWRALAKGLRVWLPSRGNVIFTLAVIASLAWASQAGAISLGMPSAAGTSIGSVAYQGRLADTSGSPLTGTYTMTFSIYNSATGGVALWEEQWTGSNSVSVSKGLFNVMLGSINAMPQSLFAGNDSLWLGIAVGADAEMTPRVQLGSVPYAVVAQTVPAGSLTTDKLADGAVTSAKLDSNLSIPGNLLVGSRVGIGTGTPQQALDVNGSLLIRPEAATTNDGVALSYIDGGAGSLNFYDARWGGHWNWQSGSPTGVKTQMHLFGGGDSSNTYLELYRADQQGSPSVMLNANGNTYFVGGNVGIGTSGPDASLQVNGTMKVLGAWENRSGGTVYQAASDGFVLANMISLYSSCGLPKGFTDGGNPPTTQRAGMYSYSYSNASIMMPVRKGDYWFIDIGGDVGTCAPRYAVSWIPFGN
jgi:hypothetical protein